jgi:drug/metabolite transporter (DMT)-like permease
VTVTHSGDHRSWIPIDPLTLPLTLLALVAFASNSILTRLALGGHTIDAGSFTAIRFMSGAVVLALLVRRRDGRWSRLARSGVAGPLILVAYAIPFSYAYLRVGAAPGALVLFGTVQLTMVGYGIGRGERPAPLAWLGLVLALAGLGLLTLGSVERPDTAGVLLISAAGAAWGAYSIVGRGEADPVASNARNFVWGAPIMLLVPLISRDVIVTTRGLLIGITSGTLATACGYIVWYRALRGLTVTAAAVAQLSVPLIAGLGAVLILGEALTARLVIAGAIVLGGTALVLVSRTPRQHVRRRVCHEPFR